MRDLNEIIDSNRARTAQPGEAVTIPQSTLEQLVFTLAQAQASLQDVLRHGVAVRQRSNIIAVDLPAIDNAVRAGRRALAAPTSALVAPAQPTFTPGAGVTAAGASLSITPRGGIYPAVVRPGLTNLRLACCVFKSDWIEFRAAADIENVLLTIEIQASDNSEVVCLSREDVEALLEAISNPENYTHFTAISVIDTDDRLKVTEEPDADQSMWFDINESQVQVQTDDIPQIVKFLTRILLA